MLLQHSAATVVCCDFYCISRCYSGCNYFGNCCCNSCNNTRCNSLV